MLKIGIRILKKLGLLEKINIEGYQYLNHKKFKVPIIKGIGYPNLFKNELWMIQLLKEHQEESVFIDIGANIGQTLLKLRSIFPFVRYLGFEPNPACVFYTQELIKSNHFENTELIPCGIADFDGIGRLSFYNNVITDSTASVMEDFRPGKFIIRREIVVLNRFETILKTLDINAVQMIKIDVEGCEFEVLKSLEKCIQNFRPKILIEILPVYNKTENKTRYSKQVEIEAYFKKYAYKKFRVIKEDQVFQGLELIDSIGIHSDTSLCDYLVLPEEKADKISLR